MCIRARNPKLQDGKKCPNNTALSFKLQTIRLHKRYRATQQQWVGQPTRRTQKKKCEPTFKYHHTAYSPPSVRDVTLDHSKMGGRAFNTRRSTNVPRRKKARKEGNELRHAMQRKDELCMLKTRSGLGLCSQNTTPQ